MAERFETWTIRGPIDVECARCHTAGAEMRVQVLVRIECPQIEMVEGDRPVEFECLGCGMVTRYGEVRTEVSS